MEVQDTLGCPSCGHGNRSDRRFGPAELARLLRTPETRDLEEAKVTLLEELG